jgi:hypothetical protein
MAERTTLEQLQDKFSVKVVKAEPDTRLSICGKHFINPGAEGHDGTKNKAGEIASYAVIPAHHADAVKANNKHYEYGEPFIAEDEKKK